MILAGDVGGTKTLLEAGTMLDGHWQPVFTGRYEAADYQALRDVLRQFLRDWTAQRGSQININRACFGVAGPTFDDRAQMTNLPWLVDGKAIGAEFGIPRVQVINDFAAAASGVELLDSSDLIVLQSGDPIPAAPRLVIGAGTGLGVAYLVWTGTAYQVIPGESGHAGFAPATREQADLWRSLHARNGRVTAEDVVSGPGLVRVHEFIRGTLGLTTEESPMPTPAMITTAALESGDKISLRALDLFIDCYGEVAGNCALATLARGGVFITGGIAPKILSRLQTGGFLAAFNAKGSYSDAVRKMPVYVVSNERLGLLGCALIAQRL